MGDLWKGMHVKNFLEMAYYQNFTFYLIIEPKIEHHLKEMRLIILRKKKKRQKENNVFCLQQSKGSYEFFYLNENFE